MRTRKIKNATCCYLSPSLSFFLQRFLTKLVIWPLIILHCRAPDTTDRRTERHGLQTASWFYKWVIVSGGCGSDVTIIRLFVTFGIRQNDDVFQAMETEIRLISCSSHDQTLFVEEYSYSKSFTASHNIKVY